MKLSHLLVDAIRTERETDIARRRLLLSAAASTHIESSPPVAKPERWLGRLIAAR